MKSKTKPKKSNGKFGRVKFPSKEVTPINPDLSQLRPPIDISVSTLYRVCKVLENGSDEVRSILAYECDLVYECRICKSLFRSLMNFISHKRIYCKEKFDITFARNSSNDYDIISSSKLNSPKTEKMFQDTCGNDRILRSQVSKTEQKKDLTAVVSMLQKKQIENLQTNAERLYLETMHSNSSAVYQTIESIVSTQNHRDLMKAQVMELNNISEQTAVLGPNGQLVQPSQELISNTVTQICDNEGSAIHENDLVCSICTFLLIKNFIFKKTLAVHTKTLHTSHRLCYPCPCCSSTFANTWSVYRHLFKVHRKSNEQVRKLRSQIQEKAFIKDTTVAEDLQKEDANKILMSSELCINETQEWMDHLESDTELQRCGGCGKRFDRKAALSAHSQYCQRRVAACESTTKVKKINKVLSDCTSNENSNETSIRVEAVASLSKADWDMLEGGESIPQNESNTTVITALTNGVQENVEKDNLSSVSDTSDPVQIVYTSINKHKTTIGSKKRKNKDSTKRLNNNAEVNIDGDAEIEKIDHVLLMEKKVASIVNFQKLQCLPCKRKFTSVNNLRRHAAIHIGWNRYQCKLCDYKCFVKCDCVAHCNKMHNAQNNRVIIEGMINQISDDQYMYDQNIMLNITNLEEEVDSPEIVEVRISPEHIEPEVQIEEKSMNEEKTKIVQPNSVASTQQMVHVNEETQENLDDGIKGQHTLGLDPDLRKMVMEVIFGSSEVNSTKQVEVGESILSENSNSKLQNKEDIDIHSRGFDLKVSDTASVQDGSKPQRPIRNKIKPLNKDFIYDLKDVTLRKDPLIVKPFNKSFAKKSLTQEEDNLERDTEQPSKRFKSVQNNEISILCGNSVTEKYDIKLDRDLKNNLTFSECHS
ncbi:PREDICTED: zinc finger protein 800 [Habropoda laboriosa]|uniref:zinc finger protein 800 n=1 Tax=Habropoda laboriosa TaxID=597456 RepID=UPI00083CA7EB|nr:PREDICTED: zinc finger protein 800 [Habropoda laboriosa]